MSPTSPPSLLPEPVVTRIGIAGSRGQGPHFQFAVQIQSQHILNVQFDTFPCIWSTGIAMAVASMIEHRSVDILSQVTFDQVIRLIGDVPLGKRCLVAMAVQAVRTMHEPMISTGHPTPGTSGV